MIRLTTAALATGFLLATPARAEIVELAPGGFVTRDAAAVGADPQTVWLALISPGDWWNDAHSWSGDAANMSITPQGGGCFCERIPAQERDGAIGLDGSVQHMTVLQANPRKVLRMRGALGPLQSEPADGVLTITLKPIKGGTRIVWEYVVGGYMRFTPQVIAKAVDGVMSQQLDGLAESLGRIDDPEAQAASPRKPEPEPFAETDEEAAENGGEAEGKPAPKAASLIGEDFLEGGQSEGPADTKGKDEDVPPPKGF